MKKMAFSGIGSKRTTEGRMLSGRELFASYIEYLRGEHKAPVEGLLDRGHADKE